MHHIPCKSLLPGMCLTFLFLLPIPACAIPAITCHCFTDRSYDASRPAAADAYLLATTQNSFFSIVFHTDKKTVVMKKQQGTSSDDLWMAYWVAARTGLAADNLLKARAKGAAWKNVIEPLRLSPEILGERPTNALRANAPDNRLAETVVDELFLKDQLLGAGDLTALRQAGATNQELIMAVIIVTKTRQSARRLYLEVKNGTKTWGGLLNGAKIDTKNMQQEISAVLRLQPMISDNSST